MAKELPILLVCDADPDRPRFGAGDMNGEDGKLEWRGIEEGLPRLVKECGELKDSGGNSPRFTWCLRCDEQIAELDGEYGAVLSRYRDFFFARREAGDEIAWHPHMWRKNPHNGVWYQEYKDTKWQKTILETGYREMNAQSGEPPQCVKTGWCMMNNQMSAVFEELGILADLSCLSGQSNEGKSGYGRYDWKGAPAYPYRHDKGDYRKIGGGLAEIPVSSVASKLVSTAESLLFAIRGQGVRLLSTPEKVGIKLTYPGFLFRHLLNVFFEEGHTYFHAYFHPDELLSGKGGTNRLLYSPDNAQRNIARLLNECERRGFQPVFTRARDFAAEAVKSL